MGDRGTLRHLRVAPWGVRFGRLWQVQWSLDGTVSLGLHVDPRRRISATGPFGPYVDVHFGPVVVSFGYHPARANGLVDLLGAGAIMRADR